MPPKRSYIGKKIKKKRDEIAFQKAKKIAARRIKAGKKKKPKNEMGY